MNIPEFIFWIRGFHWALPFAITYTRTWHRGWSPDNHELMLGFLCFWIDINWWTEDEE